jgi:uncharacterized membrane protein
VLARAQEAWQDVRSSWWFVPSLMAIGAIVLAFVTTRLDSMFGDTFESGFGLYAGGAEGSRSVLETVAVSMITVAGVTFSIVIVVMTLASSQFGPRLLRTFMRDRGNQITLGTFIATFIFSVLVLRTVRGENGNGDEFVPHLSVTVAMLLTLASLAVFIYFIHHSARSIQVNQVIEAVGRDLDKAVDDLYPGQIGHDAAAERVDVPDMATGATVESRDVGYVQLVSARDLLAAARENDVVIELLFKPGGFVIRGTALARVLPADRLNDELADKIRRALAVGEQRTEEQDLGFAIDQLEQICLRALSPALNDALTAVLCIDRLAASLARLAERELPSPLRADDEGRLRVIAQPVTLVQMLETAFAEIRRSARTNVTASTRLLAALGAIGARATRPNDLAALRGAARLVVDESEEHVSSTDIAELRDAQRAALELMSETRATRPAPI